MCSDRVKRNQQMNKDNPTQKARKFMLVDKEKRESTDLRDYEDEISEAVYEHLDIAEDDLIIMEDCFLILNYEVSSSDAIKIGRALSSYQSPLFPLCKNYPLLFTGCKVNGGREYCLVNEAYAEITDLRWFKEIISNTVKSVCPDAELEVYQDYYSINTPITNGEAREIGKRLGKNPQLQYLKKDRFVLFEGKDVMITI